MRAWTARASGPSPFPGGRVAADPEGTRGLGPRLLDLALLDRHGERGRQELRSLLGEFKVETDAKESASTTNKAAMRRPCYARWVRTRAMYVIMVAGAGFEPATFGL